MEACVWAAEQIQKPDFLNQAWVNPALWYAWTGRYNEAAELIGKMVQNCRRIAAPPFQWVLYLRPYLAWQRGAFDEAMALVTQALRYPHLERLRLAYESVCLLRGQIHLALDDLASAEADFQGVEQRARTRGMELIALQAWIGGGQVALRRGDGILARTLLQNAADHSQQGPTRNPLHFALASRYLGELASVQADYSVAREHLHRALEVVSSPEQDNLIEQGYVHMSLGNLALCQKDQSAAKSSFDQAAILFGQIDNRYALRQLSRSLERMGRREITAARAQPDRPTNPDTPTEISPLSGTDESLL